MRQYFTRLAFFGAHMASTDRNPSATGTIRSRVRVPGAPQTMRDITRKYERSCAEYKHSHESVQEMHAPFGSASVRYFRTVHANFTLSGIISP